MFHLSTPALLLLVATSYLAINAILSGLLSSAGICLPDGCSFPSASPSPRSRFSYSRGPATYPSRPGSTCSFPSRGQSSSRSSSPDRQADTGETSRRTPKNPSTPRAPNSRDLIPFRDTPPLCGSAATHAAGRKDRGGSAPSGGESPPRGSALRVPSRGSGWSYSPPSPCGRGAPRLLSVTQSIGMPAAMRPPPSGFAPRS